MTGRAFVGLAVVAALGFGCDGVWPASMEDQPSLGPHEAPRVAPPGTVALGVPVVEDREDVEDLENPFADDAESAARGAKLFVHHCTYCHGKEGRGDGKVSAKFPPAPNLRHYSICRRSDGFLWGTFTAGGRAMPPVREGLTADDRWDLVSFVRELQREGCTGMPQPGAEGESAESAETEDADTEDGE